MERRQRDMETLIMDSTRRKAGLSKLVCRIPYSLFLIVELPLICGISVF